jgi:hypothetical protein
LTDVEAKKIEPFAQVDDSCLRFRKPQAPFHEPLGHLGLGHFRIGLAFRKDREIVRISNQGSFSFDHALQVIGYANCRFHTVKRNIREQWRDYTSLRCSRFCC